MSESDVGFKSLAATMMLILCLRWSRGRLAVRRAGLKLMRPRAMRGWSPAQRRHCDHRVIHGGRPGQPGCPRRDTDVAVVGRGPWGLSTALHCVLLGRSVVVIDRRAPGSKASGRWPGGPSRRRRWIRTFLARRSIEKVRSFAEWAGVPLPVATSGSLLIARSACATRRCWPPRPRSPAAGEWNWQR